MSTNRFLKRIDEMVSEITTEEFDYKLRRIASIALHKSLVKNDSFPSCINCVNFTVHQTQCLKFKMQPPADVIVFSCGIEHWEADIPF